MLLESHARRTLPPSAKRGRCRRERSASDRRQRCSFSTSAIWIFAHCTSVLVLWTPPITTSLTPAARAAFCSSRGSVRAEHGSAPQVKGTMRYLPLSERSLCKALAKATQPLLVGRRLIGRLPGRVRIIEIGDRQRNGLRWRAIAFSLGRAGGGCPAKGGDGGDCEHGTAHERGLLQRAAVGKLRGAPSTR